MTRHFLEEMSHLISIFISSRDCGMIFSTSTFNFIIVKLFILKNNLICKVLSQDAYLFNYAS